MCACVANRPIAEGASVKIKGGTVQGTVLKVAGGRVRVSLPNGGTTWVPIGDVESAA